MISIDMIHFTRVCCEVQYKYNIIVLRRLHQTIDTLSDAYTVRRRSSNRFSGPLISRSNSDHKANVTIDASNRRIVAISNE